MLLLLFLAGPVPLPSPSPAANEVSLGAVLVAGDGRSHEFLEYRDVPGGLTLPAFRFTGRAAGLDYHFAGRDAGQDDQRFRARIAAGAFAVDARLDDLPHRLGEGRTMFGHDAGLTLPAALRRSLQDAIEARASSPDAVDYTFLAPLAADLLRNGRNVGIGIAQRESTLDAAVEPGPDVSLRVRYGHRRREGERLGGVGFGLRNAVEVPEPVDDTTHTVGISAALERSWGLLSGGFQYDGYRNRVERFLVDNPFRAEDATAPGAHLGPDDFTTAGARRAEVGTAPDNDAVTATAGAAIRLPLRTRVNADVSLARWRQADTFAAFTTNGVLDAPPRGTLPLSLDGAIDIHSWTVQATTTPWRALSVRARARSHSMENNTPRVPIPGVARLDAVWEAVPRLTVPYSHARTRLEGSLAYAVGSWRLEAGHRQEDFDRTFRETQRTTDGAWTGIVSGPLPKDGHLRLHYERAHRGFAAYDSRLSPGASRTGVHPVRSLAAGRRYDQAVRDLDRAGARVEVSPAGAVVLSASYALERRQYPETPYGLVRTRAHVAAAEATFAPGGRWSAHAFHSFQIESSFQRTRHSPETSIAVDLRNIWDATLSDRVLSVGGGVAADLLPGRTMLRLDASFQRSDGHADFESPPGGIPDVAFDIDAFDDVRWLSLSAEVEHLVRAGWWMAAGAAWDAQQVGDTIDEDRPGYVPGAFVLAPPDFDYGAALIHARITRRW